MKFEKLFTPLLCERILPLHKDDLQDTINKCNDGAVYKDKEGMNFCEECASLIFDKYKKDEE